MEQHRDLYQAIQALGAQISESVAGKTLLSIFEKNVEKHADKAALHASIDPGYQQWQSYSWHEYQQHSHWIASGLYQLGIKKKDIVCIVSKNRPEHNMVDIATLYANAIPSSLYPTLKGEQLSNIVAIAQSKIIFCDQPEILKEVLIAKKHNACIEKIILMQDLPGEKLPEEVMRWSTFIQLGKKHLSSHLHKLKQRKYQCYPEDSACILFTSGTTGKPKGVTLTHHNILWTIHSYLEVTNMVKPEAKMISYLPMAHITERVAHHYHAICRLGELYCAHEITDLKIILPMVRPNMFFAVPRVWEKFYHGLQLKIQDSPKAHLINHAIANGMKMVEYTQSEQTAPWSVRIQHWLYTQLIFKKILKGIGLDKAEIFGSGAAALNPKIQKFFHAINIPITEIYGLTENTAPTLSNLPNGQLKSYRQHLHRFGGALPKNTNKIGSVGLPIPGTMVRCDKDGEIQIKGKHLFSEYYQDFKSTQAAFLPDRWFRTGDLGHIDKQGFVHITGRKKEIIVTSGGKNIAPVEIENHILASPLISQVCVIGDARHYLTALITLNTEGSIQKWCKQQKIDHSDLNSLVKSPLLYQHIQEAIKNANTHLAPVQQIKKFTLLPQIWTPASGELTPTLKLKRFVISRKYANEIDKMYSEDSIKK